MQPPQVGLQLPTRQLCLKQQSQVAKDKGIQGGRAGAEGEGEIEEDNWTKRSKWS